MNFPDLTPLFVAAFVALCISVPLAVWKLVELVIWVFSNVSISIQ